MITQRPWSNDCHATAAAADDTDDGDDDDGAKVKTQKPTIIIHLVTWLDFDKAFIFLHFVTFKLFTLPNTAIVKNIIYPFYFLDIL